MRLVDETLDAWRQGERLLQEIPQADVDHVTVRFAVATLKIAYQQLTETETPSERDEAAVRRTVVAMRAVLDQVGQRYRGEGTARPD